MRLDSVRLSHYRNYDALELSFSEKTNVLIGENAQGKTNLLEAIYVLALAKSHRTTHDKELIGWDQETARVEGRVVKRTGSHVQEIVISGRGKKAKLNHLEQRRLSDYVGALNIVLFAPEDLHIVKGSPQVRRRFLDMEIGQVSPVYLHELSQYLKVLKQRNALLKQLSMKGGDETFLDILTEQMITLAVKIVQRRHHFMAQLEKWARPIHDGISRGQEELALIYRSDTFGNELLDVEGMTASYTQKFGKIKENEIRRGVTLFGPHRDDFEMEVNGRNVQTYGSQGQQRTAALSLKLAEIELIHEEVGEYPLLLLDDVLSELDDHRQTHLLDTMQQKVQTILTTTSVDGIAHETINQAKLFHVKQGTVDLEETSYKETVGEKTDE
ncbi:MULTISPECIES: DNA replication/repair protein RecF [unclassified Exiguobacterium]|uniref:DNA replication/repair protein RecF n=1 Tax=unclassified Exiguobacterium TaxID=2644629 RepID=UPI000E952B69|nr:MULTISPECIES: DNA replication/repair protein RecF [unclassified Exiguobacterium]MDT0174183.1 DNA replication/repair protein RecF [Exiguobacterium sp. BRG2]HAL01450.1 DNA replication/repair protein RecF [Exiguobacterium sp.]HBF58049.1 DNA replication/repair protein RecF [Exiguobacterium sp.]